MRKINLIELISQPIRFYSLSERVLMISWGKIIRNCQGCGRKFDWLNSHRKAHYLSGIIRKRHFIFSRFKTELPLEQLMQWRTKEEIRYIFQVKSLDRDTFFRDFRGRHQYTLFLLIPGRVLCQRPIMLSHNPSICLSAATTNDIRTKQ